MKIYEILLEEDSGVSSGDSGSADSGDAGDSGSDEATPSTDTSTTTSGNVATVIYPLGSMIARPYFNYVRPSKKCKYGKKKDGKCKKKPA